MPLERLPEILQEKRELALSYKRFFKNIPWANFLEEPIGTYSNYWLCAISLNDATLRDTFLDKLNTANVMTRPVWKLMTKLPMYSNCQTGSLDNSKWLSERVVCLPSGVRTNG